MVKEKRWLLEKLGLISILVFAFLIRIRQAGLYSYWADDVDYLRMSTELFTVPFSESWTAAAPLYLVFQALFREIFTSHILLLLLPISFGILSVYFIYYLGYRLYNKQTGYFAALLLALSPIHIHYSLELKPYTLSMALTVLSFYFFKEVVSENTTKKSWVFLGLVNSCLLYTHYYSIVILFIESMLILSYRQRMKEAFYALLTVNGLVFLLFVPWFGFLVYSNMHRMFTYNPTWISDWTWLSPVITFIRMSAGYHCPRKLGFLIAISFLLLLVWGLFRSLTLKKREALFSEILMLVLFFSPIALASIGSMFSNIYLDRYLLFVSIPLYLLVAHGMASVNSKVLQMLITILLTLSFFMPLSFIYLNRIPRENAGVYMRKDVENFSYFVRNTIHDGDVVISSSGAIISVLEHYLGYDLKQPLVSLKAMEFDRLGSLIEKTLQFNTDYIPRFLPSAILNEKRLWLIHTSWPTSHDENKEVLEFMDRFYDPVIHKHFYGIECILYEKKK